jgi:pectinesterase
VTISYGLDAATAGSNDASGTVRVHADDISFYNINIANTFGQGAQAIALSAQGNRTAGYAIKLTGFQDTYLANKGL